MTTSAAMERSGEEGIWVMAHGAVVVSRGTTTTHLLGANDGSAEFTADLAEAKELLAELGLDPSEIPLECEDSEV